MGGSFTFGRVASAVSGGLGLYAGMEVDREKERVRQQWDMAMADMREKNSMARETRMAALDQERYLAGEETKAAADKLTAEYRTAQLEAQGKAATATLADREATRKQQESQFVRDQVSDREESLDKLLVHYDDSQLAEVKELDTLSDTYQQDKDEVEGRWGSRASTAIQAHVASMAAEEQANPGSRPGYEVNNENDIRSRLIRSGLPAERADTAASSIYQRISASTAQAAGATTVQAAEAVKGPFPLPPERGTTPAPGNAQHAMEQGEQPLFIGPGAGAMGSGGPGPAPPGPATAGASNPQTPYFRPGTQQVGSDLRSWYDESGWVRDPAERESRGLPPRSTDQMAPQLFQNR